jgi:two-component system chemotaxis response regulator CheB
MQRPEAIVIGCSLGGLRALKVLLGGLDSQLPVPVLLCSHTGNSEVDTFCSLLANHCALPVEEARERMPAAPGVVHVAPGGYHLLIESDKHFALSVDDVVRFSRPSIDVLFDAAAEVYRDRLIGVVLTGANADGAEGLAQIRSLGGTSIVQLPADAEAPEMPQAALDIAGADHCLPLHQIAPLLNRLCLS